MYSLNDFRRFSQIGKSLVFYKAYIENRGLRKFRILWRTPYGRFCLGLYGDDVMTLKSTR